MTYLKKHRPSLAWLYLIVFGLGMLTGARTVGAQIRTVLVSPVPGNPVASGTALRNALAGIASPSAADRWLVKIEPGIYDVGGTSLAMRPFVDVEGSGIEATVIKGNGDASGFQNATILGADNMELRFLTVQAIGPTSTSAVIAMANYGASPRLYRVKFVSQAWTAWGLRNVSAAPLIEECEISVTATATGSDTYGMVFLGFPPGSRRSSLLRSKLAVSGATNNYGVYMEDSLNLTSIRDSRFDVTGGSSAQGLYATSVGGWSGNEALTIRDTEISSFGGSIASYGVRFEGPPIYLVIYGSTIWGHLAPATYGIYSTSISGSAVVQGSSITGFTKTIQVAGNASISSTLLQGGPATAAGWLGCMGVWDENAVFYAQGCP